jgi:hypothetical protein
VAEGRVSVAGKGIGGAEVFLVPAASPAEGDSEPPAPGRTERDGTFRVAAPPGPYLLLARRGDQFGYFGRNPVNLTGRLDGLTIPLVPTHPLARETVPAGRETLSGRVLDGGAPVEGARVFVYLEATRACAGPDTRSLSPPHRTARTGWRSHRGPISWPLDSGAAGGAAALWTRVTASVCSPSSRS